MPLCSLRLLLQLRRLQAAVSTETFPRLKLRPRLFPCSSCPGEPTCKSPSKCRRFSPTVSPSCGPYLRTEKTVSQPHLGCSRPWSGYGCRLSSTESSSWQSSRQVRQDRQDPKITQKTIKGNTSGGRNGIIGQIVSAWRQSFGLKTCPEKRGQKIRPGFWGQNFEDRFMEDKILRTTCS